MDYDFDATLPALRLVPRVFDDELLASYWNRVTALHCFSSKRVTTSMAWEERWRNVGVRLPTNVLAFWTRAGHRVLPTAQDWLFLHTMFPVYACALPIDRQRSLSSKLMLGGNGPVVPALSLLASDRQRFSVLVCSRCEEEDVERWGTSVWRRSHNSPGVSVCLDHSRPLERLLLRSDPPRRLPVLQAGDEIGLSDIRLAKAYVDLLRLTPAELLAFATNLRARANAFLGRAPESAVNSGRVAEHLLDDFAAGWGVNALRASTHRPGEVRSAVAALFASRPKVHPLWIALLNASLAPWKAAEAEKPKAVEMRLSTASLLDHLRSGSSLTEVSFATGVDVSSLSWLARANGLTFAFRPSKMKDDSLRALFAALSDGRPIEEVAASCGVSVETVYRVLRSHPQVALRRDALRLAANRIARRDQWAALERSCPGVSRTELRKLAPALWTWLYRNDREWLQASIKDRVSPERRPRQPRRSRVSLDISSPDELFSDIQLLSQQFDADASSPRLSRTKMLQLAGVASTAAFDRLPPPESTRQFVARRLTKAVAELLVAGEVVSAWKVLRRSRLRATTLVAAGVVLEEWLECALNGKDEVIEDA